jgi:hypothetical protein
MASHLGMKATNDFSRFETDIRAIRQILLPAPNPNRLIDEAKARQLRSKFREMGGQGNVKATTDAKQTRRKKALPTKKTHAQAMARRLEKLREKTPPSTT